jgi:hypothetical protein
MDTDYLDRFLFWLEVYTLPTGLDQDSDWREA